MRVSLERRRERKRPGASSLDVRRRMQRTPRRDSLCERAVRSAVHQLGFRFRVDCAPPRLAQPCRYGIRHRASGGFRRWLFLAWVCDSWHLAESKRGVVARKDSREHSSRWRDGVAPDCCEVASAAVLGTRRRYARGPENRGGPPATLGTLKTLQSQWARAHSGGRIRHSKRVLYSDAIDRLGETT